MSIISFELLMNLRSGGSGIENTEGFGRFLEGREEPEENFASGKNQFQSTTCEPSSLFRALFIWKDGDLWPIFAAF